jgi:hypothetical protein
MPLLWNRLEMLEIAESQVAPESSNATFGAAGAFSGNFISIDSRSKL